MVASRQPPAGKGIDEGGGKVAAVTQGSPGQLAGVVQGDLVVGLDGHELRDILDYQFHMQPGEHRLRLRRGSRLIDVPLSLGVEDPGIAFESAIFDRVRTCACDCLFCFVDQLPAGLRPSLYVRDDDFRLSFMGGNFITLNNLRDADLERIEYQRLSPLYVSIHATDPQVRAHLMGVSRKRVSAGLDNLRRLGSAGIDFHVQIVLCPGINDGTILQRTVADLATEYAGVVSVGVVPVSLDAGYLEAHPERGLRTVDAGDCRRVLAAVTEMQGHYRRHRGTGFVYAADEFYLQAGEHLPEPEAYDGYPQFENGIGIAASFLEDLATLEAQLPPVMGRGATVYMLTGELAADVVSSACSMLERSGGARFRPLVCANRLFGPHVTVTGLLGGSDVIACAGQARLGREDMLLLPASCLSSGVPLFLDGVSLEEAREALPCSVLPLPSR